MKLKELFLISGILTLSIGILGCNQSKWSEVKTMNIAHPAYIGGFETEQFGITVGYSGETHYTKNGGDTWPQGNNKSYSQFGLDIVNDKLTWSCGNGGRVRKTTDGGENWIEVTNFGKLQPNHCRYASFLDENTGWLGSYDYLGATKDGGQTWTELALPDSCGQILSIDLLSENHGYIVDSYKKLFFTKDSGSTWDSYDIPDLNMTSSFVSTNNHALRFTDEKNGILFYYTTYKQLKGLKTKDGGQSWKEVQLPQIDISKGGLYLSHDGKLLSVNSSAYDKIILLKEN